MRDLQKAYFTIQEFADELNIHHNTVRNMIKNGKLHAFKLNPGKRSIFRIPGSEFFRIAEVYHMQKE